MLTGFLQAAESFASDAQPLLGGRLEGGKGATQPGLVAAGGSSPLAGSPCADQRWEHGGEPRSGGVTDDGAELRVRVRAPGNPAGLAVSAERAFCLLGDGG